jgi:LPXTG-site transpeptidase (sortase) family protein
VAAKWLIVLLVLLLALGAAVPVHAQPAPFGHVYIPRLALSVVVSECPLVDRLYDTSQLGQGVCHLEGTATIDDTWARIDLAGHTPGGFSDLYLLRIGDDVLVWNTRQVERYQVVEITTTDPYDTRWLFPTPLETLTLITCDGPRRLIVHSVKVWPQ